MNVRSIVVVAIVVLFAIGCLFAVTYVAGHARSVAAAKPACVAQTGELCPTEEFADTYREFMGLRVEVANAKKSGSFNEWQHKQWQLAGMASDLARAVPQGYSWDEAKFKFVALQQVTPQPSNSDAKPAK